MLSTLSTADSANILVRFNHFLSPTQRVIRLRLFGHSGSLLCIVALCEKFSSPDTALNLPSGLVWCFCAPGLASGEGKGTGQILKSTLLCLPGDGPYAHWDPHAQSPTWQQAGVVFHMSLLQRPSYSGLDGCSLEGSKQYEQVQHIPTVYIHSQLRKIIQKRALQFGGRM